MQSFANYRIGHWSTLGPFSQVMFDRGTKMGLDAVVIMNSGWQDLFYFEFLFDLAEKPNIGLFYFPQTDKAAWRATPIGVASQKGNVEIIKCLIPFEDNLNAIKIHESIRIAKLFNHQHVVKYLISILNKL